MENIKNETNLYESVSIKSFQENVEVYHAAHLIKKLLGELNNKYDDRHQMSYNYFFIKQLILYYWYWLY